MEHIAKAIKRDPMDVRLKNLKKDDDSIIQNMIQDLKVKADFEERKRNIEEFNKVGGEVYFSFALIFRPNIHNQQLKCRYFYHNVAHKLESTEIKQG